MNYEQENSDIYLTPEDRKTHIEPSFLSHESENLENENFRENKEESIKRKEENAGLKKKKKNFILFSVITIVDLVLVGYILYLIISIFADIA